MSGENMNEDVVQIKQKCMAPLKVGNKIFKSAYDWELTEEDLEKAARELGETEEKKTRCLRKLKEKLSNESNVKFRQDDDYLLRYLRVRKYDVSKAYQNLKMFSEDRRKFPNIFALPPDPKLQKLNWLNILPYKDEERTIIFYMQFDKWNPEERRFEEIFRTAMAVCDLVSMNPNCQINGVIGVWNADGITGRQITEILWTISVRTFASIAQNGYPWRIKKLIVLNTNRLARLLYTMAKPFLQKKVTERIFLLGSDVAALHRHVNPALLPKTLKGHLEDKECDASQHVLDNLPYLRYERMFI